MDGFFVIGIPLQLYAETSKVWTLGLFQKNNHPNRFRWIAKSSGFPSGSQAVGVDLAIHAEQVWYHLNILG